MTKVQAQSSIKSLSHELGNLTPSSLVTLFEIDISNPSQEEDIYNLLI